MLIKRTRALLRQPTELNSLFGEILDWLLAPLLFLWPISIVITYHAANGIADVPYDKALADNVRAITRQVNVVNGHARLNLPAPARALLHAGEDDTVYFQVLDAKGRLVAGDMDIPPPEPPASPEQERDAVRFRDDRILGEDVRIAWLTLTTADGPLAIQVAETRGKRTALARKIVSGVLLPQFIIIPLAVVLVYLGLGRGIAPLKRLKRLIERRHPTDLSPIAVEGAPEEVRPLILAFNDMMARLEETLQSQQRFIADAAHQMRTPLTGLILQAELAMDEEDPAQVKAFLERIAASAQRAAHLINQLLALARAESSFEHPQEMKKLDLEEIGQDAVLDMDSSALSRGIDLSFDGPSTPVPVDGNPLLLKELAKNLLDNAIKYSPRGGRVVVRVLPEQARGDGADIGPRLEVEDGGIGIPETERSQVFDRFYRVLGSGAEGSGLGLAIVKEIAEQHGAIIELLPRPAAEGTLARVSFPFRHPALPNSLPGAPL